MEENMNLYVIDACGLIAYLRGEEGGDKLRELFRDDNSRFFIHSVNLGEVYYDTLRFSGQEKAQELFEDISELPVTVIWELDVSLIELAGKYKTSYRISYADSFVIPGKSHANHSIPG